MSNNKRLERIGDKEKEKIDVIFNTSEYGRYCFT